MDFFNLIVVNVMLVSNVFEPIYTHIITARQQDDFMLVDYIVLATLIVPVFCFLKAVKGLIDFNKIEREYLGEFQLSAENPEELHHQLYNFRSYQ